ncbi:biotin transporter BioY [Bacillus pseudomycoides]|uniref:Biotin transporter n=1 Tax=Bacillus pseudomycoides TaxID=64104 RepID=A0ABD6T9E4_9BACI|nr:biotin transporter BioY [Bacillus pseudomycoides]PDZ13553.1 biotin transporter BioY [Bacillus pseudomycoides]PEJ27804.1 biotin transporter BioY [Bacillus pseudomycoides]PEP85254.1 biotin transporter BioY [Bacillus pseudomycoides]PFW92801.1 biotin transporter BioY [Bacillus pseudomycoides]PFX48079.1 biotin transporter BioY [Bacillus pseudomycoides]
MNTKNLVFVALFSAVMGVLGLIPPIALSVTPVPITLQSLGVMLAGGLLGSRLGALSQMVFLFVVGIGAPLLAGGRGGPGVFVSPSAGYLIGYVVGAFVIGYLVERLRHASVIKVFLINIIGGILVVYIFGVTVQSFIMDISVWQAIKVSVVFLPGDFVKAVIAAVLVPRLYRSLKHVITPAVKNGKISNAR